MLMTKNDDNAKTSKEAREEREAAALRANLRRRKDQQRALALEAEARKAAEK